MKNIVFDTGIKTAAAILYIALISQCSGLPENRNIETNDTENIDAAEISDIEESIENPEETEFPDWTYYANSEASAFQEVWGYVVAGSENALTRNLPVTDVCYFSAGIDTYGKLSGVPRRSAINFPGRVHLVLTCDSRSLTYFILRPGSEERQTLINDLLTAARDYDGLNIDLELIPARSMNAFLTFLQELRNGLPQNKMLTICLPARTRKLVDDIYDYDNIKPLVDRIFVMAYDEHWSGSAPGSVASLDWCRRVADYSLRTLGSEKLVMGIPFYGRAWGDYSPSRALIYNTIQRIIDDNNVTNIRYENGIPAFDYNVNVSIKVYFEDEKSLSTRMNMYRSMNVRKIGFWRLGQETRDVWNYIKLE